MNTNTRTTAFYVMLVAGAAAFLITIMIMAVLLGTVDGPAREVAGNAVPAPCGQYLP